MLALAAALGRRKPGWRSTRLVSNWVGIYNQEATSVRDEILVKDIVPMFTNSPTQNEMFSKELTKTVGGISTAIQLRSDIQRITAETSTHLSLPVLQSIDRCIQNWISVAFCVDSLALKRVTFDSSGTTLECIARADTVHIIRSISALKKRFHPGRRCYALFHHALPNYPLAFIHIGLTSSLATSMRYILAKFHI